MIQYTNSTEHIHPELLTSGFFCGWPNPPSPNVHLQMLKQSSFVVLALDESTAKVVGFITAITDGVLCAYIPLLEVLPEYRHRGIGAELARQMLAQLSDYYMVDLSCDETMQSFYEKLGMNSALAMIKRNYQRQSGR